MRSSWNGVALLGLATALVSPCSTGHALQATDAAAFSSMFRGGANHSGVSTATPFPGQPGIRWSVQTGGIVRSSPAVTPTRVFVGSGDGALYAIDRATGSLAWRIGVGGGVHSSPAVSGGLVIAATILGNVIAVDENTGHLRWSAEMGKPLPSNMAARPRYDYDYFSSSPVVAGSMVVVGSLDGAVYAFDRATGHRRWRTSTGGRILATPAVEDGTVVVGSMDGRVYALDLATGARRWVFRTVGDTLDPERTGYDRRGVQSSAAIVGGNVYFGSRDDGLYSLDAKSGRLRWRISHQTSWVVGSPAVDADGHVFVGSSDGHFVQAVDASTGRELWHVATGANMLASPLRIGDLLIVGSYATTRGTGEVMALDAGSGVVRWRLALDGSVLSSPVAANGELYVGTDGGSVVAIHEVGKVAPQLAVYFDSTITARPFVPGGRLAFEYFRDAGYSVLDRRSLGAFLRAHLGDAGPSAIVLASDALPLDVLDPRAAGEVPLIRKYLDAGGKVVGFSAPLGLLAHDSTGKIVGIDPTGVDRTLGMSIATWNPSDLSALPTSIGRTWGLERFFTGRFEIPVSAVTLPLALDELGMSSAWVQVYRRDLPGTGYVQLWGLGATLERLPTIRRVTEFGLHRSTALASAQQPSGIPSVDSAAAARNAWTRAEAALRTDDTGTARRELSRAALAWPTQPSYSWASTILALRAHDTAAVLDGLRRYAALGLGRALAADAELRPLIALPAFADVRRAHEANVRPIVNSRAKATFGDSTFWPEAVDADPRTRHLYVTSIRHRTIADLAPDGTVHELWPRDQRTLGSIFGVRVDTARNVVWATMSGVPQAEGSVPADSAIAALLEIRPSDGRILERWDLPVVDGGHVLGDLAIGPRGDVFMTDSRQPFLYRLRPGADTLEAMTSPYFHSLQGIAPTPDGRVVYVADYSLGMLRLDLETGKITRVEDAPSSTSLGLDGINWDRGAIVGIQNGVTPPRVVRLLLNRSGTAIQRVDVIDRNFRAAPAPSIGTILGSELVYVANGQWDMYGENGERLPNTTLSPAMLLSVPLPTQAAATDERFEHVEHVMRQAIADRVVPAVVGLIGRRDRVLFRQATGEIEPGVPMPANAIARVASITKPITATAVLLLVEEKKLRLSDRVDRWFPGFGARVQHANRTVSVNRPVTVRDLLTHQAGLATEGPAYDSLFDAATAQEFARRIGAMPLRFQPGTRFEYGCCGSAYEVLGAIVEKVTGQSYAAFLEHRVLHPLRMNDTYFSVPPAKRPRLAGQYRKDTSGALVPFRRRGEEDPPNAFYSGAGGLRSTVDDYHRFVRFLLNGGELDGVRLLSAESVRAMTTNQVGRNYPDAGYGWGYGVRVRTGAEGDGPGSVGSFGWSGGTGSLFLADPARGLIFVIFAPSSPGTPGVDALRDAFVVKGYEALSDQR